MFHRALALAAALLTATPAVSAEKVSVALDWTPNTNHVGLYVAQAKGYYADAGLDVQILPYADTSSATLVANGVADFGVIGAMGYFSRRAGGADVLATYAVVQHETGRLVFLADREEIQSPKDLVGLRYGGFGSDWEKILINAMIEHDGGKGGFEMITLGTSVYEALANKAIDFTLEVYTWEGVRAELHGPKQRAFRYADYGVPDQHTTFIGGNGKWIAANPDAARAFVQATQKGYAFAAAHPEEAADILMAGTGGFLTDRDFIVASLKLLASDYFLTPEGVAGPIDADRFTTMGDYFFANGMLKDKNGSVLAEKPDFTTWFSNDYLAK